MFNPMATVLITGGTGLIGQHLSRMLSGKGYDVIILSRKAGKSNDPCIGYALWDVGKGEIDKEAIQKADHIINQAGAGIADKRWTKERKLEIAESRIHSAAL